MTGRTVFLLDVNVLIALAWPVHHDHHKVQAWFSRSRPATWATCPFTQTAFVRILSNPAISPDALAVPQAVTLLEQNLAHPAHKFWFDNLSIFQALKTVGAPLAGHRQVSDAYLLGLAMHNSGKLVTMDQSIRSLLPDRHQRQEFIEPV